MPLIDHLRVAREVTHRELEAVLVSERFTTLLRSWNRWLKRRTVGGEHGASPIAQVAAERVLRAYNRLSSRTTSLTPHAAATKLHRLRIVAKKLRYLLEFFADLFNPDLTNPLVAELKLAQDSLGTYHDAWLQSERLTVLANEMLAAGAGAATLLTMGRLVADLERKQLAEAEKVFTRLHEFTSPANRRRFTEMVKIDGDT